MALEESLHESDSSDSYNEKEVDVKKQHRELYEQWVKLSQENLQMKDNYAKSSDQRLINWSTLIH